MLCHIYRCATREFTYLYVNPELAWEDLPTELASLFTDAEKIMEVELHSSRPLAQEDVGKVLAHLKEPGYHLQLPPENDPSGWLDLPKKPL